MQTIRPWLFIGRHRETLDQERLERAGIGALLHLAPSVSPRGLTVLALPIDDGEPLSGDLLWRGVDFVLTQKAAGRRVLVACGAGISRSTTFAIAALKEAEGLTLLDAMRAVRAAHPDGLPHPALWTSLCTYYEEPVDYLALIRAGNKMSDS
jgi:protein-tyrosine phosphatase